MAATAAAAAKSTTKRIILFLIAATLRGVMFASPNGESLDRLCANSTGIRSSDFYHKELNNRLAVCTCGGLARTKAVRITKQYCHSRRALRGALLQGPQRPARVSLQGLYRWPEAADDRRNQTRDAAQSGD
jgi:hypothetical protein